MLNKLRKKLKPLSHLVAIPFMKIHPNILSFGSFVVAMPGFVFLSRGNTLLGSLFLLGALFDSIDGEVARSTGKTSKFGGVLDATLDRIFDASLLFALAFGQIIDWPFAFILAVIFISISYIKAKAEAMSNLQNVGTNKFSVGLMQRGERLIWIFVTCFVDYFFTSNTHEVFFYSMLIVLAFSIMTLVYRGIMISRNLED